MKTTTRTILSFLLVPLAVAFAFGGAVPAVEVMVSNSSGKEVFKGTTNGSGGFATGVMPAGNYVVQFNSKSAGAKGGKFGLAVTAGKNQMTADSVAGSKLADAGVAMRIAVDGSSRIVGQVSNGGHPAVKTAATATAAPKGESVSGNRVKIINGKRYIWVVPQSLTLAGGQWVEESEALKKQNGGDRVIDSSPRSSGSHY